jgi:hypothetical protein
MKLGEYLEVLGYDAAFWMAAYTNPSYPLDQLGEVTVDVTAKLRTAAIVVLLAKGDTDAFFHNLIRSARCRIAYLERLAAAGITGDHHQASARVGPFLDAVAAEDFTSARRIAALSPRQWMQGHEYEDDYLYAQIVHGLIAPPSSAVPLDPLFERMEAVLNGQPDARLDVTRALAHRDQAEFDSAFDALMAQRTAALDAQKARRKIEDPVMVAQGQIDIEGLALLRIAARLNIPTQDEYLYCPSIARTTMRTPFPGE